MSESAVESTSNAIFTKLDLFADDSVQRRVAAVITYLARATRNAVGPVVFV